MTKYEPRRRWPRRVRRAPDRRAAGQGDGPEGVAAVRRHAGDRPHRGHDGRRRQHRQVHRLGRQPGADRHPNNLEAAEEVVRQLRLRDIGGIIVVDFIDMVLESNRDLVLRRLTEALGPRPHPPPGVRGDLAGPGAVDPQAAGHRPDRGVLRRPARTARAAASCCTPTRSTRRSPASPERKWPSRPSRQARQEGRAARPTRSRSAKVPGIPPASIRCSRRWPRPTARRRRGDDETMTTRGRPTRPEVDTET